MPGKNLIKVGSRIMMKRGQDFYPGMLGIGWQDEGVFDGRKVDDKLDILANVPGNYVTNR